MVGRGLDASGWEGISSNVRVWNNVNPLGGNGTQWVSAAAARAGGTFEFTDRNNLAVWFCDKVARTQFESVDLTFVARGGSIIGRWHPDETEFPMLQECIAVWRATNQAPANVFLWHQGEGDTSTLPATYRAAFEDMLVNLTDAGVIDADTFVILGGLTEGSTSRHRFNANMAQRLARAPRRAYASSYGLTTYDGTHFDSASLTALGARRYFSAYRFAKLRAT